MKLKYISSVTITIAVISIMILSILKTDEQTSMLEGRTLQVFPMPNNISKENQTYLDGIMKGETFKILDKYFSDHIIFRDKLVDMYTLLQKSLNKKYVNEVYISKDNYMISVPNINGLTQEKINERINWFYKFAQKYIGTKIYTVNIPSKNMVYKNNMPIKNYNYNGDEYIDFFISGIEKKGIPSIDCREALYKNDNLYFKTDHHWNMNGVYESYKYIIDKLNEDKLNLGNYKQKKEFSIEKYKNIFLGSDGKKVARFVNNLDDIELYKHPNYDNYEVYNIYGEKTKGGKLFYEENLSIDKLNSDYTAYLGGDRPLVKIINKVSENELKLITIGDSMDNPLIPLLALHFKETYSFDLRYKDNVINTINEIKPDVILFMGLTKNFLLNEEVFNWNK